jgi:hypothetical protein
VSVGFGQVPWPLCLERIFRNAQLKSNVDFNILKGIDSAFRVGHFLRHSKAQVILQVSSQPIKSSVRWIINVKTRRGQKDHT